MNYFVMLLITGAFAGLLGLMPAQQDPPCKCEVTVYKKKRKGAVPCIVGILRDSATQKPLTRNSLVFNSTVDTTLWADKRGHTYTDVLPGKEYTLIAKCFPYYFCTQKVVAQQGDSIVCVFNMRLSREGSDGPGDFIIIHK